MLEQSIAPEITKKEPISFFTVIFFLKSNRSNKRPSQVLCMSKTIAKAKENASDNDLILIGGSTFVVAELDDL